MSTAAVIAETRRILLGNRAGESRCAADGRRALFFRPPTGDAFDGPPVAIARNWRAYARPRYMVGAADR